MAAALKRIEPAPFCTQCGRPKVPIKQLVLALLEQGAGPREIARQARCSRQYVQSIKRQLPLPFTPID